MRRAVGTAPEQILAASGPALLAVVMGMRPTERVARLRRCADWPSPAPPGRPTRGSEPLACSASSCSPAPDRCWRWTRMRCGCWSAWGTATLRSYPTAHRQAQTEASLEVPETVADRQRAHQLLRRHGQTRCRRTRPECPQCPIAGLLPVCREPSAAVLNQEIRGDDASITFTSSAGDAEVTRRRRRSPPSSVSCGPRHGHGPRTLRVGEPTGLVRRDPGRRPPAEPDRHAAPDGPGLRADGGRCRSARRWGEDRRHHGHGRGHHDLHSGQSSVRRPVRDPHRLLAGGAVRRGTSGFQLEATGDSLLDIARELSGRPGISRPASAADPARGVGSARAHGRGGTREHAVSTTTDVRP